MSDLQGRVLPLSRPAPKTEPLRNLVVQMTTNRTLTLEAHSWADISDGEDAVIWVAFYREKKCIAQLPAAEIRCIFDADVVNSEELLAALRKPATKKKPTAK